MPSEALRFLLLLVLLSLLTPPSHGRSNPRRSIPRRYRIPSTNDSPVYLWPLPTQFSHGDGILYVDPDLFLDLQVPGDYLEIVSDAFERYKDLIFTHWERSTRRSSAEYDVAKITVIVSSTNDTLQFGVDESYILYVGRGDGLSVVKGATIEANTIYGALRGLETFSQLCIPNYTNKSVEIQKAPWSIKDEPRFNFRGLLIDTSRHYLPVNVIKQVIDAMSYAKLNVLHWHILDEESFPLEVPSYPNLWKGSYSKLERYTIEDAYEVVDFAKKRGIHIMAEVDVPGHAESWGSGYPDLWPSANCTEPLDVSKNFTFEVISGILSGHENGAKLEHKAFGTWSWSKEHALAVSHDMGVFHDTDVFLRPKLNEEQSENKTNNAQHGLVVPPRHSCAPSGSQRAVSSSTRSGHGGMAMPQP